VTSTAVGKYRKKFSVEIELATLGALEAKCIAF